MAVNPFRLSRDRSTQLLGYVRALILLEDETNAISRKKADIYAEARSAGLDRKLLRQAVRDEMSGGNAILTNFEMSKAYRQAIVTAKGAEVNSK